MIDELKRQLAELDKDLKPVLAHVSAVQERRAGIVRAIASQEAIEAAKPKPVKPLEPVKSEPVRSEKKQAEPQKKG